MGLFIENKEIIGACIGAVIGALLTAYTCYVVSKVKHDYVVKDEANAASLKGEEVPSWRIEKSETWYKGYKLALVALIVLSTVLAMATCLVVKQYGYAVGAVECGAVGFFAATSRVSWSTRRSSIPSQTGSSWRRSRVPSWMRFFTLLRILLPTMRR